MSFCSKCGKELNLDAAFCHGCGAAVGIVNAANDLVGNADKTLVVNKNLNTPLYSDEELICMCDCIVIKIPNNIGPKAPTVGGKLFCTSKRLIWEETAKGTAQAMLGLGVIGVVLAATNTIKQFVINFEDFNNALPPEKKWPAMYLKVLTKQGDYCHFMFANKKEKDLPQKIADTINLYIKNC
jgi:hypothetical protein